MASTSCSSSNPVIVHSSPYMARAGLGIALPTIPEDEVPTITVTPVPELQVSIPCDDPGYWDYQDDRRSLGSLLRPEQILIEELRRLELVHIPQAEANVVLAHNQREALKLAHQRDLALETLRLEQESDQSLPQTAQAPQEPRFRHARGSSNFQRVKKRYYNVIKNERHNLERLEMDAAEIRRYLKNLQGRGMLFIYSGQGHRRH